MRIEIDQSVKVEQTSRDTVVAYADGKQKSIKIFARDKREIEQVFRRAQKPKMFIYKIFALLVYLLIKNDLPKITMIVIDREYIGWEALIKNYLFQFIKKDGRFFDKDAIQFTHIGKSSPAHKRAIAVARGNARADVIVSLKSVMPYLV